MPSTMPVLSSNSLKNFPSAFCILLVACPTVQGILPNSIFKRSDCPRIALKTSCAVNLPSLPICLNCPIVVPIPSAIAFASLGACSMMEFNSSPRNVPEPKACPNCTSAASCDAAEPPPSNIALETSSVNSRMSLVLFFSSCALRATDV